MDILYLFRESGNVRIPFTCYNPALFRCFISAGGKWDTISHSFVFTGDVDTKRIITILQMFFPTEYSMIPIVQVQENSGNQEENLRPTGSVEVQEGNLRPTGSIEVHAVFSITGVNHSI